MLCALLLAVAIVSSSAGRDGALVQLDGPVAGAFERPAVSPEALQRVLPESPTEAKMAGIAGTVLVQALVRVDGLADHVTVIRSRGELDRYAVEAIREWRFRPATKDGEPVAAWVAFPVEFFLAGDPVLHPLEMIWPPCAPVETPWPEGSAPWGGLPARASVLVRKNGRVGTVRIVSAPPGEEKRLVGAIKGWTFTPAEIASKAVDVWIDVEVGPPVATATPARAGSP